VPREEATSTNAAVPVVLGIGAVSSTEDRTTYWRTPIPTGQNRASRREKRKRRRERSRHAAWIALPDSNKRLPCVIWDKSGSGARIAAAHVGKLPNVFSLILDNEPERICAVAWRKNSQVGVAFIESAEELEAFAGNTAGALANGASKPTINPLLMKAAPPYRDSGERRDIPMSAITAVLVVALAALTVLFYVAGHQSAGPSWATQVCDTAGNFCLHPEISSGASPLLALVYFATRGMEL